MRSIYLAVMIAILFGNTALSQRKMEYLDRGLVAVKVANGVFLSWRVLGTDAAGIAFNVYRDATKITPAPVTGASNLTDASGTLASTYTVRPVINGVEQAVGGTAAVWASSGLSIQLQQPAGGTSPDGVAYTYEPNDCTVGDVDGDGQWEIILKWNPTNAKDNSQSGYTGNVFIDCYKMNGTRLWRIDLGRNIRAGAHYTQILVGDYNSDGYAEVVCKTAPATKDGSGAFLSKGPAASDDDTKDYRNTSGYILSGPEYLTVFNGKTGKEMATVQYSPVRGTVSSWGDSYGNRVDRFNATNAYLDGARPSMVFQRGYYTRMTVAAWDWDGTTLKQRWFFDSNTSGNGDMAKNGNHSIMAADGDGDGYDEIFTGSGAIDHDGKFMWSTKMGHGDANHIGDLNSNNPGLEIWQVTEEEGAAYDHLLIDAKTGKILWGAPGGTDNGRGMTGDIDASYPGHEMWSNSVAGTFSQTGASISASKPSRNFRVYWDGDLLDELLDGNKLDKWNGSGSTRLVTFVGNSCNTTKATPNLSADIIGDWREEVILHDGASKLYVYTSTVPTANRMYTLMHDPVYRNAVSWQNSAYNQPPHLGFWLGAGTDKAPKPNISLVASAYNSAPQINITGPSNNTSYAFQSAITLTASASDTDGTVASVSFYNGATLLGTATAVPYSYTWTGVTTGTYSITASATDNKGASSTSAPISVTVRPGTYVYAHDNSANYDWANTNSWTPKAVPTAIDTAIVRTGEVQIKSNIATLVKVETNGIFRMIGYFTVPNIVLKGGTLKVSTSNTTYGLQSTVSVEQASIITAGSAAGSIFNMDGTLKGSANLTKTGIGILKLNLDAANYTGGWTVAEGTLQIARSSAIGDNTVSLASGAVLDIAAGSVFITEIISVNGTINAAYDLTVKSLVVNGTSLAAGQYTSSNYPGTISGSGTVTVLGTADCAGVKDGTAYYDNCGTCVSGTTGKTACVQDCHGEWGGVALIDQCGICTGGSTGKTACNGSAQAEDACSFDGTVDANNAGFTGAGFVNFPNTVGSTMQFNLTSTSPGTKTITIRYANGGTAARSMALSVNGNSVTVDFVQTGSWTTWRNIDIQLQLAQGVNQCSLTALGADGGPNIDQFIFTDAAVAFGSCAADCNGEYGGQAFLDNCNTCVGGNTGREACTQDCHGDWGGGAYIDDCLVCTGGNTGAEACRTQAIQLAQGWNLISINVHPADSTIATLFKGLDVQEIKDMNTYWRKDQPSFLNLLQTITPGEGYLVKMNAAGTLSVAGTPLNIQNSTFNISNGWQLIGCPYPTAAPIAGDLGSNFSEVKDFDGFWLLNGTANTLQDIEPGKGYFIKK